MAFAAQHPFDKFERYQIKEVREAAIKGMYSWDTRPNGGERSDWAEKCVKGLLQNGDQEMAKKILEWYIFESVPEEAQARALKFALTVKNTAPFHNDCHCIEKNDLAKMIGGKIKKDPKLYFMVPGLAKFFEEFLRELEKISVCCDSKYYEDDWNRAERVLCIVALVRDISFLPILERLSALFRQKRLRPNDETNPLTREIHKATFDATVKILKTENERS